MTKKQRLEHKLGNAIRSYRGTLSLVRGKKNERKFIRTPDKQKKVNIERGLFRLRKSLREEDKVAITKLIEKPILYTDINPKPVIKPNMSGVQWYEQLTSSWYNQ